ncbi:CHY zinc finger protein [Hymenobacter sp. 5317J-9]|uniref:CHY zinc finger protein n=1 Tax=Hymenobacter sp. 5317J-9 TaxID=2932250 RepID=UPI001FD71034|nr:CHY zinc finger protein [Hymenobacter sp. 5317J-9]UOQ99433.1 CHY zinc finger protein [Hymenobacter sp. 5317J-9]
MRPAVSIVCHGTDVNERTQCAHWHSERDIIGIRFKCCDTFYACFDCHQEAAGHAPVVWPAAEFDAEAIYCGNCNSTLSIECYLSCGNTCPHCQAAFNPGCARHYPLYFEQVEPKTPSGA